MKYSYICPRCRSEELVTKSISEVDRVERCSSCSIPMKREISASYFHFKDQREASYNPAFGKVIRTKSQQQDEIKRLNYEKGMKIEEVGDSTPVGDGPKRSDVDMQDVAEHTRALIKNPYAGV